MKSALIGYTGFVGSNLCSQRKFDDLYNSKNITSIQDKNYDELFISAAPAAKWVANKEPDADLANINKLCDNLSKVTARLVILVSTVDVYPNPINVDENNSINIEKCHPYGKHRLILERFIFNNFNTKIIRLPGLFGKGLKKNVIFDYLNNNQIEKIDTRNIFQFYFLNHLNNDLNRLIDSPIKLLNMATEPIRTDEVARICIGKDSKNYILDAPIKYDFKSVHADLFSGRNGYLYSKEQVIEDLMHYVQSIKNA